MFKRWITQIGSCEFVHKSYKNAISYGNEKINVIEMVDVDNAKALTETSGQINTMLSEWDDPLGAQTFSEASDLIHELRIELAGKESVIKALHEDIRYYRKDHNTQMLQDTGLDTE